VPLLPARGKPPSVAREVVLLDEASRDLVELAVYIANQSGETVAGRYLDRLYAACMALAHFPERGTKRDDIAPGLRTVGFERRATIAFRVLKTRVEIITIAYAGRDFERELRMRK
jgi:toxin ParE1/3/4